MHPFIYVSFQWQLTHFPLHKRVIFQPFPPASLSDHLLTCLEKLGFFRGPGPPRPYDISLCSEASMGGVVTRCFCHLSQATSLTPTAQGAESGDGQKSESIFSLPTSPAATQRSEGLRPTGSPRSASSPGLPVRAGRRPPTNR